MMGVRSYSGYNHCEACESRAKDDAKNPDPANFEIEEIRQLNGYIVVTVNYPNCTTYEGNKILVYPESDLLNLLNTKELDPHFSADGLSPIARFPASPLGKALVDQLVGNTKIKDNIHIGVHMSHCFQGEYENFCKYGDMSCPAAPFMLDE